MRILRHPGYNWPSVTRHDLLSAAERPVAPREEETMLKEIAIVTISVANLGPVQEAWQESLGYKVTESGTVSAAISELWKAPEMQGKDYVLMAPANGAPTYIRFVANESAADIRPMTTHGWNATELLVRDTDSRCDKPTEVRVHDRRRTQRPLARTRRPPRHAGPGARQRIALPHHQCRSHRRAKPQRFNAAGGTGLYTRSRRSVDGGIPVFLRGNTWHAGRQANGLSHQHDLKSQPIAAGHDLPAGARQRGTRLHDRTR